MTHYIFNTKKTHANDADFLMLVRLLDQDLKITDGDEHWFYNQFNSVEEVEEVIIIYHNEKAVGCGALRKKTDHVVEIKRMYTLPIYRRKGVATLILKPLEEWAKQLGYKSVILETGKKQPFAIALHKSNN